MILYLTGRKLMTRKEFFDWLSTCPTEQMHFHCDEDGITTITFHHGRKRKNKKETKPNE